LTLVLHYFALKLTAEEVNPPCHALHCHPKAVSNACVAFWFNRVEHSLIRKTYVRSVHTFKRPPSSGQMEVPG